jgi:magnesium transporter
MISRYTHQGLVWVDLECPTADEANALSEEFGLHPIITSELMQRSEREKADIYENAIYLILNFPIKNRTTGNIEETEIDFVLMKNTLVTTHYELVDPLHDFARLFEADGYLKNRQLGEHAGFIFFAQMRELYKHTHFLLEGVERSIRHMEKDVFNGDESSMVTRLSETNRALIDIRSAMRFHKEVLKSFSQACARLYGPEFIYYTGVIESDYVNIERSLEENRQMLQDLRKTNDSLFSAKTNESIRRLTVFNVIMLPLGFIAWVFAMHSKLLNLDDPRKLVAVFVGMALIAIVSVLYFRSKKWL